MNYERKIAEGSEKGILDESFSIEE